MYKFFEMIEKLLMGPMTKLSEQRHLRAIRDGIVSTMALIIVGSFFLIIAFPPIPALAELVKPHIGKILLPFRLTMGLMALYASYGIGYSLSKSYKLDGISGGILSMAAFLLTSVPVVMDGTGWVLPMGVLGGSGMFVAILTSIFAVEVMRFLQTKKIMFKMPEGVPDSVARSFEALIPAAVVITVIWIIRHLLGFDIQTFIMDLFKPLVTAGNTLPGVLVPIILITILWVSGIHGVSVVGAVARPIWLVLLDENVKAAAEGAKVLPNIAPEPFFQWFVWIGGSGATLALVLWMLFSKSDYLKKLGKATLLPGICNINEPVIFGAPVMLNPILAIPFIIGPIITGTISYIAMALNLVTRPSVLAPWTLPAPIGAYLATGGDFRAVILVLINIAIMMVVYYPFFKAYENKLLKEEKQNQESTATL
ncbi:PTS sugar transporter subunit IIC [Paramaledivibacter caminithermalis]|jgi:PTS system cellobiose-specific IIC component|uniref:Permease IIC component n=1 Tax=Paramaledivibacter caminithermalis (strain DSM 15212 / CIP 107654 / DViRD3) TaxID=1121301 RepID=A0A1M6T6R0_PARC5|nr:PTS sugar transporter subunit IIC [Paramaledivibacter caminithermalis]SHK52580.1 PTS system, cellobiose-specific IIC component [Paramaledivibacter caminithermalis DSM 15212]